MGFPLTNYKTLKLLADVVETKKRDKETAQVLTSTEEYSVFAFIIFDPIEHKEFKNFFERNFRNLHYATGQNLAFFGLVDSSDNYNLRGINQSYDNLRTWIDIHEENNDTGYNAFAFAQSMNLTLDDLPSIIVTSDLRLRSFQRYKTSPNTFELQLLRLTSAANECKLLKRTSPSNLVKDQEKLFLMLSHMNLDLCNNSSFEILNETLARTLSDILSFMIDNHKTINYKDNEIIQNHKNSALNKILESISNLKGNLHQFEESSLEQIKTIEELSLKAATFMALSQTTRTPINFFEKSELEKTSLHLWQTALDVQQFLNTHNTYIDFSPSAICLAKMFEQEINYSFGHWIRDEKEITLPDFFNKKEPGKSAVFHNVDFNRGRNGKWLPPELGKSKYLAQNFISKEKWIEAGIYKYRMLLNEWNTIHSIRNKAAHTETVSSEEVNRMKSAIITLDENNIITQLCKMKNEYKGIITI